MLRIYFTGHISFSNRGCEAIVRSTVQLLSNMIKDIEFYIPSNDIARDLAKWPEAESQGVKFVQVYYPFYTRPWVQFLRLPFPLLHKMLWPFPMNRQLKNLLQNMDAIFSIGGDMYTFEGRLPIWIFALDRYAYNQGKPVFLWGATIGPFPFTSKLLTTFINHFTNMKLIAVRESVSEKYLLNNLNLKNVIKMTDSAFWLEKQNTPLDSFWPEESSYGVVGLNFSPLLNKLSKSDSIRTIIVDFITSILDRLNMSVLLVPHVIPNNQNSKNNDYYYLSEILSEIGNFGGKIGIADPELNAAQLKYVISKCRFFVGARTHSTIAALSANIPTISVAYSRKAYGINVDIFGSEDYVIDYRELSLTRLFDKLTMLIENEESIKKRLQLRTKELKNESLDAAAEILNILS